MRGVFIIDFVGNGVSSRAVIRKGALSCLIEYTIAGHLVTIITEDRKICGKGAGMWLRGRFHASNDEGRVILPYSDSDETVTAVLVSGGFADITKLALKRESYKFKCAFVYNQESFLEGSKAQILIQPRLYVNDMPANLQAL